MFKHILIPTDGSDLSRKAMLYGVELAKESHAKVTALTIASWLLRKSQIPPDIRSTKKKKTFIIQFNSEQDATAALKWDWKTMSNNQVVTAAPAPADENQINFPIIVKGVNWRYSEEDLKEVIAYEFPSILSVKRFMTKKDETAQVIRSSIILVDFLEAKDQQKALKGREHYDSQRGVTS